MRAMSAFVCSFWQAIECSRCVVTIHISRLIDGWKCKFTRASRSRCEHACSRWQSTHDQQHFGDEPPLHDGAPLYEGGRADLSAVGGSISARLPLAPFRGPNVAPPPLAHGPAGVGFFKILRRQRAVSDAKATRVLRRQHDDATVAPPHGRAGAWLYKRGRDGYGESCDASVHAGRAGCVPPRSDL